MPKTVFKLESVLESHERPFVLINANLRVIAVNRAWELFTGVSRENLIGKPCCENIKDCRHQQFFQTLEPYAGFFPQLGDSWNVVSIRGYPLINTNEEVFLGEKTISSTEIRSHSHNDTMLGCSPSFLAMKSKLAQAAAIHAPVLLNGETGTGKEIAAQFLHDHAKAIKKDLVVADCTTFGEDLFESELFGHEKGAFTGALTSKKGLFELADGGILFLDEIGELPLSQQAKLLRAIESGQFRRVGGTITLRANVRIISATHRNLAHMVQQGHFREDLYYRLSVFPIQIPPLRDRREDVPLLANSFIKQFGIGRDSAITITEPAMQKLLQYEWPGNIRELKNCLLVACGLCQKSTIQAEDIYFLRRTQPDLKDSNSWTKAPTKQNPQNIEQFEAQFIIELIDKYQSNLKLVASEMNISLRTLYRKLHRHNLK